MFKTQAHLNLFLDQINKTDGCWLWNGATSINGYGIVTVNQITYRAHRVAFEWFKFPVPNDLVLDHLCRVRNCVNPDHLEAVDIKTNTLRGMGPSAKNAIATHCLRDHAFTPENTYLYNGKRICKACRKLIKNEWRAKQKVLGLKSS